MILYAALLSLVGLGISAYAYWLEQKIKSGQPYKAACDISDVISCSKPLLSEYGRMIVFSNSIAGAFFYSITFVASLFHLTIIIFLLALIAVAVSIFLAYILYAKIKALCLVCTSIYVINVLLLVISYINL